MERGVIIPSPSAFAVATPADEGFDLSAEIKKLSSKISIKDMTNTIKKHETAIIDSRALIVSLSKSNFELERKLDVIDKRINLLVKNRISVAELQQELKQEVKNDDEKKEMSTSFKDKRVHFETMFRILQSTPYYFAKMARLVESKDEKAFIRTVVIDVFGDQYNTREERLLLLCFQLMLTDEINAAEDMGALFRANTVVTSMLSEYARRGQGLSILQSILQQPLKALTSRKNLNLEINPQLVYREIVTENLADADTPSAITDDDLSRHPEVNERVGKRLDELINITDYILHRITDSVEMVPYGMRWICKQLSILCRKKFPSADKFQIGSIIGGYIFLRFFTPAIGNPSDKKFNFIDEPTKVMRRNLILISKVVQNLSNGVEFGQKEPYMSLLNPFLRDRKPLVQSYFERLVDVHDLEDSLQIDKCLKHIQAAHVEVLQSQIFLCHSLLHKHFPSLQNQGLASSEMRDVLKTLSEPTPVLPDDDFVAFLELDQIDDKEAISSPRGPLAFEPSTQKQEEGNAIFFHAKEMLLEALSALPEASINAAKGERLLPFLEAEAAKDPSRCEMLTTLVSSFKALEAIGMIQREGVGNISFEEFLSDFSKEVQILKEQSGQLTRRGAMIKAAEDNIEKHNKYLLSRLALYSQYLENVKKGGTRELQARKDKKQGIKFTLYDLHDEGVVVMVSESILKKDYKKVYVKFTELSPAIFRVEVSLKGVDFPMANNQIDLSLEDLLVKKQKSEMFLEFKFEPNRWDFRVDTLIPFLNQHFKQTS